MFEQSSQTAVAAETTGSTADIEAEIRSSFEMSDKDFEKWKKEFIARRTAELIPDSQPIEISGLSQPTIDFIGPDTELKPKFIGRGFHLDDPQIYHSWLDIMRKFYSSEKWQDPVLHKTLLFNSIQYGIQKYVGNVKPSSEKITNKERRLMASAVLHVDDDVEDPQPISIAENKDEALCTERSAIAHNLLCFNGIGNYLYAGKLTIEEDEIQKELHAFIIFRNSKGNFMIYDPMNPEFVENQEEELVGVQPAIYQGGDEILQGKDVIVEHHKYLANPKELSVIGSKKYAYHSNPLLPHLVK